MRGDLRIYNRDYFPLGMTTTHYTQNKLPNSSEKLVQNLWARQDQIHEFMRIIGLSWVKEKIVLKTATSCCCCCADKFYILPGIQDINLSCVWHIPVEWLLFSVLTRLSLLVSSLSSITTWRSLSYFFCKSIRRHVMWHSSVLIYHFRPDNF